MSVSTRCPRPMPPLAMANALTVVTPPGTCVRSPAVPFVGEVGAASTM